MYATCLDTCQMIQVLLLSPGEPFSRVFLGTQWRNLFVPVICTKHSREHIWSQLGPQPLQFFNSSPLYANPKMLATDSLWNLPVVSKSTQFDPESPSWNNHDLSTQECCVILPRCKILPKSLCMADPGFLNGAEPSDSTLWLTVISNYRYFCLVLVSHWKN